MDLRVNNYFRVIIVIISLAGPSALPAKSIAAEKKYTESSIQRALTISSSLKNEFFLGQYHYWRVIHLQNYPFREIFANLVKFVESTTADCKRRMRNDAYVEHIMSLEWTFFTLSQIATRHELAELESRAREAIDLIAPFDTYVAHRLKQNMRAAKKQILLRDGPLLSIQAALDYVSRGEAPPLPKTNPRPVDKAFVPPRPKILHVPGRTLPMVPTDEQGPLREIAATIHDHLKRFDQLTEQVVEQDEIIEALKQNEARRYFFRQSQGADTRGNEPSDIDVFNFAGPPGTGKDTLVEAFVDALHDRPGAHLDHLLKLSVHGSTHDAWNTMGSPTGYKGSGTLSPLIRFLVYHSAGRYAIKAQSSGSQSEEFVIENPDWRPGMILPGYETPDRGVILANDLHQWSLKAKDIVLLEALDKGRWRLNNPGPGLSQPYLYVPCRIFLNSNYGTTMLYARDQDGQRYGPSQKFAELKAKWRRVRTRPDDLKQAMFREYLDSSRGGGGAEQARGTSEELGNRIPLPYFFSPISPEGLGRILKRDLKHLAARFQGHPDNPYNLEFDSALIEFVVDYDYDAEENGRPLRNKLKRLIEEPLVQAYVANKLKPVSPAEKQLHLGVIHNENGTSDLRLRFLDVDGKVLREDRQYISATISHLKNSPVSNEQLQRMFQIEDELGKYLIGQTTVKRELANSLLLMVDRAELKPARDGEGSAADAFMFLGLSSTGKTQAAKAVTRVYLGSDKYLKTISFTGIVSEQQVIDAIVGKKNAYGKPELSEFLKHYDANDGRIVVLLDELSVAHPRVHMALYDILREPYIEGVDGRRRSMSHVIPIITGNVGKEWYDDLPRNLNDDELMSAWIDIYEQAMTDETFQRATVDKVFPEPLVNRITMDRTYFFGPLRYRDIRGLTLMALNDALRNELSPKEGQRGWNVQFADRDALTAFVEDVEEEGFKVREQGASVVNFMTKQFARRLRPILLRNEVEPGSLVLLRPAANRKTRGGTKTILHYEVKVEGREAPIPLQMIGKPFSQAVARRPEDQILVGIHEASHEVVRRALFGNRFKTKRLRNVSGATLIGGKGVHYEGIAESQSTQQLVLTRQAIIQHMAVLFAGDLGQMISTEGGMHDAGKANDIQRASDLARTGILRLGLSDAWGREAVTAEQKLEDYIQGLSRERRELFDKEFNAWMDEARLVSLGILIKNQEKTLYPLAMNLIESGELEEPEIDKFYETHEAIGELSPEELTNARAKFEEMKRTRPDTLEAELLPNVPRPKQIADLKSVVATARKRDLAGFQWPSKLPINGSETHSSCVKSLEALGAPIP